jgi:replicative DNA helicase
MNEPVPLHSIEAEEAFLGSLFALPKHDLKAAISQARAEHFFLAAHRVIFRELARIASCGDLDFVVFKSHLVRQELLGEIGGEEKLIRLGMAPASWTSWPLYLDVIVQNWQRRELQRIGAEVGRLAFDERDTQEAVADARKKLHSAVFETSVSVPDIAEIELSDGDEQGIATAWKSVDRLNGQGFIKGQTTAVCAYHKGGKTAFMVQCSLAALQAGRSVVYATLADLDPRQIKRRMLKQMCGFSQRPDHLEAQADFQEALNWLNDQFKDGGCRVYDGAAHGRYVEDLFGKLAGLHLDSRIELVFVDYIQKCKSRERGARDSKTAELEYVSDVLCDLSKELSCPVVFGSQITPVSKGVQTTKYARGLEEDAGMVIQIGEKDEGGIAEIAVPFQRFGPEGKTRLRWNPKRVRFEELA